MRKLSVYTFTKMDRLCICVLFSKLRKQTICALAHVVRLCSAANGRFAQMRKLFFCAIAQTLQQIL